MEHSPYDIFLSYNVAGVTRSVGYVLARDKDGLPVWQAGLEDSLVPQTVLGQPLGSAAELPKMNLAIQYADFSGGCGQWMAPSESRSITSYSHTIGVDLSYRGRGYLQAERQASTTLTGTPVKVVDTLLGPFMITTTNIYQWNVSVWTSRLASVTPTDIALINGVIVVAMGTNAYRYSVDGITWTTSTAAFNTFTYFSVRPGVGGTPTGRLIDGIEASSTGAMRIASNVLNGTNDWSASIYVADFWEAITGITVVDGITVILKESGITLYDGAIVNEAFPMRDGLVTTGGNNYTVWSNGLLYVAYGSTLFEVDIHSLTMRQVYPLKDRVGHPALTGLITAVGSTVENVYFAITGVDGYNYIIKGNPTNNEWHTWHADVTAGTVSVISGQRIGVIHATNPVLIATYATAGSYYILPRPNRLPDGDTAYRFDINPVALGAGRIVFPFYNGGTSMYPKFLAGGAVLVGGTQGIVQTVNLIALLDPFYTEIAVVTANGDPAVTTGAVTYQHPQPWWGAAVTLTSVNNLYSPQFLGAILHTVPAPTRRRRWDFTVALTNRGASPLIGRSQETRDTSEAHLFALADEIVTLTDRATRSYTVKVDNVQQVGLIPAKDGLQQDQELYRVSCFAFSPEVATVIWGTSD